jgi:succinylglutamic semialdehyde dehydrogenase
MPDHSSLYINNTWKKGSGSLFQSKDPSTGDLLWKGYAAAQADVDEAVQSAHHAHHALDSWSSLPLEERKKNLLKFKEALEKSQDNLAEIISLETGKMLWDSQGEVKAMISKVDISIEAFAQRCPEVNKTHPAGTSITRHKPHGVVAVFGPFNFPGHLPNGHIIPALLAGNTVVFKPSELTPLVAEETIRLWESCGLPPGVLNLIQGGLETGQHLASHPLINGLFFTGSYPTGLFLSELFGKHPEKILALEMGGNNPLLIGSVQDKIAAAYLTIQSAYLSSGQRCTCARRLIVSEGSEGDLYLDTLVNMIKGISIGRYRAQPAPFMGPLVSEEHALKILAAQSSLIDQGAHALLPASHLYPGTGFLSPGLIDVTPIKERSDQEIFGPLLQLIRVKDFEEGIKEANKTCFGLAAGLLSDRIEEYEQFYRKIQAGIINWNAPLTGASSAAPFGGIGCSGNHRPSAYYAADYCAYPVASIESSRLEMPTSISPGIIYPR